MPHARQTDTDALWVAHSKAPGLLLVKRSIIDNLSWRLADPGSEARQI